MVSKLISLSWPDSRRQSSSFIAAPTSSIVPESATSSSQARNRAMAAPSRRLRGARALQSRTAFLIALGSDARVGPRHELRARRLEDLREADRRGVGVEAYARARSPSALSALPSAPGAARTRRPRARWPLHVVADLGRIDEQRRPCPVAGTMAKASATGVWLDVAAADIEQPSDRIEHGQQDGVDLRPRFERACNVADLVLGAAPGEFDPVRHHRRGGRARAGPATTHRSGSVLAASSLMPDLANVSVRRSISLMVCRRGS